MNPENNDVWVTRNGTGIRIGDITDTHLINIIHFIEKQTIERNDELFRSDLGANIVFEGSFSGLKGYSPEDLSPQYHYLVAEARRRNLKIW